jgi:hypothetical protein
VIVVVAKIRDGRALFRLCDTPSLLCSLKTIYVYISSCHSSIYRKNIHVSIGVFIACIEWECATSQGYLRHQINLFDTLSPLTIAYAFYKTMSTCDPPVLTKGDYFWEGYPQNRPWRIVNRRADMTRISWLIHNCRPADGILCRLRRYPPS